MLCAATMGHPPYVSTRMYSQLDQQPRALSVASKRQHPSQYQSPWRETELEYTSSEASAITYQEKRIDNSKANPYSSADDLARC